MPFLYHQGRFPPQVLDLATLFPLVGPANAAVARYEGVLASISDPDILLSPLTSREAVLSSKIEGTQVTLGDVLEFEAQGHLLDESSPKKADARKVLNYRAALHEATRLMEKLPLSQRLIKATHQVLMDGVRSRNIDLGNYRGIPNSSSADECTIEKSRFVPPGAERIEAAMAGLEQYIHSDAPDRLVQLAIVHAEFKAIHPFLNGNGRIGRLIIPLFLYDHGLLSRPNFYLSEYLEANRREYHDRMLAVSRDDDWSGWVAFFLRGIITQADANTKKAQAILALYQEKREAVVKITHSQYAVRALDWIFQRPLFKTPDFIVSTQIPAATARKLVGDFRDHGILRELVPASGRAPATLVFSELLNITEGRKAF